MSELAKFVAAALEEGVAVDLEEENKQLQKKNEKLEAESFNKALGVYWQLMIIDKQLAKNQLETGFQRRG